MSGFDRILMYQPRARHGDGGVTNAFWLWAEALREVGPPVHVLYDPRLPASNRPVPPGITLCPVAHRGAGRLVVPQRMGRALVGAPLLVLHSGYVLYNLAAGAAARRHGVPYVVTPHGAYDPNIRSTRGAVRSLWERAERRLLERALAVHVFFGPEIEHVRALAPTARTVVAPTPADLTPEQWQSERAERYVAWLGRYDVRHKGIDRLLDAMAALPAQQRPQLRLHGRDHRDTRTEVQRMVVDRRLEAHVLVGGPVDGAEKQRFLDRAGAYVHPARWESYGIALVENLARGLPCVTTTDTHLAGELDAARAACVVEGTDAGLAGALALAAAGELARYGPRGRDFVRTRLNSHDTAAGLWHDVRRLAPPAPR